MKLSRRGPAGRLLALLWLLFALFGAAQGHARALEYKVGPAPAWVLRVAPASAARKPHSAVGGIEALLSDKQTRIDAGGKTTFVHMANKALSSSGIDGAGNIAISFEPSYQSLTLHAINLIRDGVPIDKLGSARIQVLQRETELEYRIYDGRKTVNVDLDDLRVGDIVEYSYSISGHNPVFRNKVSGAAALQYDVPLDRIFVRVLAAPERALRFASKNTRLQPTLRATDGYRDYRWNLVSMPGLRSEKDAPAGFDPQASVAWTEFDGWAEVVQWALPLYTQRAAPGPAVGAEIARIAAASAAPSERLRAVLRLVQRDIRYLGVEIGASTHAPAAPDVVFQRRFGDCKDKATLVVAMLGALGIDARPALVHTDRIGADATPTPHAFNHVIVRARLDGTTYWIDPTRPEQEGDLAHLDQPDYGMALVLDGDTRTLQAMHAQAGARRTVRATFDASGGVQRPAGYVIRTSMQGQAADYMRAQLTAKGTDAMQLDYLNFYARSYPGIKSAAPIAVEDNLRTNTLSITESYTIANFWRSTGNNRRQAFFRSAELGTRLKPPDALNRIAPLKVEFPEHVEEVTEVKLHQGWDVRNERYSVSDPVFDFLHTTVVAPDKRRIVLTDRYRTLADRVQPGAMAAYAEHLDQAGDAVGLTLYWDKDEPASIRAHADWRAVLAVVLFFAAVLLSLLMHTSSAVHRRTDLKLLFGFIGMSVGLLAATLLIAKSTHFVLAVPAALYLAHLAALRIARGAAASHWIYPLAHPEAVGARPPWFRGVVRLFTVLPALLAVASALLLAIKLFV